ncbi:MAG: hypothetical protein KGL39_50550 [Patescibacteria group bacterium]|nr:hypothetical protein [Patescibacteria group bacterium]
MPSPSIKPLEKITLNLFADDCDEMRRLYSRGWTEKVRQLVEQHIKDRRQLKKEFPLGQ